MHLVLVGTVHRDPACYERLRALLAEIAPDLVTVEVSPYGIRFRGEHGERLAEVLGERAGRIESSHTSIDHPAIRALLALLALPPEYRAALDHAKETGDRVPVVPVDRSDLSAAKLALVETEALDEDNLRTLLARPAGEGEPSPHDVYARARAVLEGRRLAPSLSAEQCDELGARDRFAADRIVRLAAVLEPARAVHVCGWEHLVDRPGRATLPSLLSRHFPVAQALLDSRIWVRA